VGGGGGGGGGGGVCVGGGGHLGRVCVPVVKGNTVSLLNPRARRSPIAFSTWLSVSPLANLHLVVAAASLVNPVWHVGNLLCSEAVCRSRRERRQREEGRAVTKQQRCAAHLARGCLRIT
jgi:hypothetical protein